MKFSQKFSLVVALCLGVACLSTDMIDNLDDLQSMAVSTLDRLLEEETTKYEGFHGRVLRTARDLGEVCEEDSDCGPGLDCTRAFLGKKCFPASCFDHALNKVNETFNLEAYKFTILTAAGYADEEDFLAKATGWEMAQVIGGGGPAPAIIEALRNNPFPHSQLREEVRKCRTEKGDEQPEAGSTTITGLTFEAGFLGNVMFSFLTAEGDDDTQTGILTRACFGGKLVGGSGLYIVNGLHTAGSYNNITGCAGLTSYGVSVGLGIAQNSICTNTDSGDSIDGIETMIGAGCGAGVGYHGCTTCLQ